MILLVFFAGTLCGDWLLRRVYVTVGWIETKTVTSTSACNYEEDGHHAEYDDIHLVDREPAIQAPVQ